MWLNTERMAIQSENRQKDVAGVEGEWEDG